MKRIALHFEFTSSLNSEPPSEFRIFPAGVVETTKGLFKFDVDSAAEVMRRASDWGNDYPIDYDHAMVDLWSSADPAEKGKAAGWFTPEIRDGALWATKVSWTPKAREYLSNREYRYFSPTFWTNDDGRIVELRNVALTNLPATKGMDPLVANRAGELPHQKEPTMKSLLVALGLAEISTESEGLAAIAKLKEAAATLLGMTGAASTSEALGRVAAWKAAEEQVKTLSARLAAVETADASRKVEDLIAAGRKEGKIPPSMEAFARDMGKKDVAMLEAFLASAVPVMKPGQLKQPEGGAGGSGVLTAEELAVCKQMGKDPKVFAEQKAQLPDGPRFSMKSGAEA